MSSMATTVHEPPKIDPERLPSHGSGNGGWRNLVPASGDLRRVKVSSPPPASTGIWVGLAAHHFTPCALSEHACDRYQQHRAGSRAPPNRKLHGRGKDSSREPCALA